MGITLVVGATGQAGTATVKKLLARGVPVRAITRSPESAARMRSLGVDPVQADLTDAASLELACRGVNTVVATANAAIPARRNDTFESVEQLGYQNLIAAARNAGVSRFIYTSIVSSRHDQSVPLFRCKRETERHITACGIPYVILRAGVFMDVSFAMMSRSSPII